MIDNISRRAMLLATLAACTASFAASPAYRPNTPQIVRPDNPAYRANIHSRSGAPLPQMPRHHEDPFADLILG
jgi:hypothetical protein